MRRLCVRISKCSRLFLSTCGERSTQTRLISVGSGTGPLTNAPVRFAQVDALRAIAVGIVMIHHFYSEKFFLAGFGVTLFFVLSSFFATKSLLKFKTKIEAGEMRVADGFKNFYITRWLRIWPLYYLVLALTLVCGVEYARTSFLWNVAFLSNVQLIATGQWSGRFSCLWSLSALEQFYLVWPALILLCPRRRLLPVVLVTMSLGVIYNAGCTIFNPSQFLWFAVPFASFHSLGAGALLALVTAKVPGEAGVARIQWWTAKVFTPLFLVLLTGKFFNYAPPGYAIYIGLIASLAFIHFIQLAITGITGVTGRILENPLLSHIGRMSYAIFLLHEFTALLIPKTGIFNTILHSDYRIVILMPMTILLAHLAWKFVEFPVLTFRKKYRARASRPARPARPQPEELAEVPVYFNAAPTSSTVF